MKKRFCPKCKSEDIRMCTPEPLVARTGMHPGWRCNDCELELLEFPMKEKEINKK